MVTHHADQHADRERAATEPERIDAIAFSIIARQEPIKIAHIAREPDFEGLARKRERSKRVRSDAVVIDSYLFVGREVERLVDAPDIRLSGGGRAVASAVGK